MKLLSKYDIKGSSYSRGMTNYLVTEGSIKIDNEGEIYDIDFKLVITQPVDLVRGDFYQVPDSVIELDGADIEFEELTIWNGDFDIVAMDDDEVSIDEDDLIRIINDL